MPYYFDNVSAPQGASYAAPLVGMALGEKLAGLPDAYMAGREMRRTMQKQDAFKDGMPVQKDANGNPVLDASGNPIPDTTAIVNSGFKLGGLDYGTQLFPWLGGQATSARQGDIDSAILGYGAPAPSYPSGQNDRWCRLRWRQRHL
jgi:hypothetical protein